MKPLTELSKDDIQDLKLVCFDVDGVTIKKGTDIKEIKEDDKTTLTVTTSNMSDEVLGKLMELKKHYTVAISSGRSSLYLTKIYADLLWRNAALISENGIFTLIDGKLIQHEHFNSETLETMRNIIVDLKKLEGIEKNFRAFEPKQFLITLHAWGEIQKVYEIVKTHDKKDDFYCWWNGEAFDIAPRRLNKGAGLRHLADYLGININQTMAIGNGPNDKDMIDAAGIGITTEPDTVEGDFHTTKDQHLGGIELIDTLLRLNE